MSKNLLLAEDLAAVMPGPYFQGSIEASEAFPLHCEASKGAYWVLYNGVLVRLYAHGPFQGDTYGMALEAAPPGLVVQLYTHRAPGRVPRHYSALSQRIEYRYGYDFLNSFWNAFRPRFLRAEYERYLAATGDAYGQLEAFAAPLREAGYFQPLASLAPLLEALSPLDIERDFPRFPEAVRYNLSYLLLPGGKYCTALEFPSLDSLRQKGWIEPESDLESLACSIVVYPDAAEAPTRRKEAEDLQAFLTACKTPKGTIVRTLAGEGLAHASLKLYVFLFAHDPIALRKGAEDYLARLHQAAVPANVALIRAKDAFCCAFPGQGRLLASSAQSSTHTLPALLEAFHG
ncbi:MAG TPA: hypothetical protein VK465_02450 [Fibrobacteria bacterium]|nr:hypothetical protein [Fibrobacteria bacterium]